jgi:hypothetical protein
MFHAASARLIWKGQPMTRLDWRPLGGVDVSRLAMARLQAHHAVQWLARAARAYIPAKPDDSHTNLGWDDTLDGLATHPLVGGTRLGLNLPELAIALLGASPKERAQVLHLDGRTDREVRVWLEELLGARKFEVTALDAPAPYEIPPHAVARGGAYGSAALADALAELAAWFSNANASLERIKQAYEAKKLEASPVRCWPHHFDLATLISLETGGGEQARSVNAGLSPGDEHYGEPYFYVSPYPYPDRAKLPPLPKIGHWHTEGFTAAVAPASRIIAAKNRQGETETFLEEAVKGAVDLLKRR